jgi:hypothetical protein
MNIDDDDSDLSDIGDDADLENEPISNWLEEEEDEIETAQNEIKAIQAARFQTMLTGTNQEERDFLLGNKELFVSLCEVENLEFQTLPTETQISLMKTLTVVKYYPGL